MQPSAADLNELVRAIAEARYGALERRMCTAVAPMPEADKDRYRWSHPEAKVLGPFFNLVQCQCPHCGLDFTCLPPAEPS